MSSRSWSVKRKNRYTLSADIIFSLNKYEFDKSNPDALKSIDGFISDIRERGGYENISVYGYTDWLEGCYNMNMSALRAKTVASYFITSGFPENKIFPMGMGDTTPKTSCPGLKNEKLTACLLPDRKVLIVVNPHE